MADVIEPVQRILDLEDASPALLAETIDGSPLPLWPQVRFQFASALMENSFGSVAVAQNVDSRAFRRRLARSLLPRRWDGSRFRGRREFLYVTSGVTTSADHGRERNWLVDGFLGEFPRQSVLMQWREVPSPNGVPAFPDTRTLEPLLSRGAISARLRRDRARVHASAAELVARLGQLLDDEIDPATLGLIADREANRELARPRVEREFEALLERVRPSVLVLEDACYGSHASLIALAKERGVRVVEPQHGWIGPSHPAYNSGASMREPASARLLPDELLTFGEFWGRGLRFPGRIVPIGKPHLDDLAAQAAPFHARPRVLLVVSSVSNPATTDDFVVRLRRRLPSDWTVRFRPHPSERAVVASRYPGLVEEVGVELDGADDVYRSLGTTRVVVGVESTVLFEALKFDCLVFTRATDTSAFYVSSIFGDPVPDADGPEVIARAIGDGIEPARVAADSLWRPDARSAFAAWAEGIVPREDGRASAGS
jgi:hypothetical protein